VLYPHEVKVWDKPVPAIRAECIAPFEAAMLDALVRARFLREPGRSRALADYRQKAFVFYNGYAPYHYGKHQFLERVRSLGYGAPAGVLVCPGEATDQANSIRGLSDEPFRFLKPLLGSRSRGLYVAASSDDAVQFLAQQHMPYVVQEYLPPQEEWRYILHRTCVDIQQGRSPSIRMAYEKLGPPISSPVTGRIRQLGKRLSWREPESGTLLRYRCLPDPTRVAAVDVFMRGFLVAYEALIDAQLATLCIDLGFTQRGPVFYESQLPFGDPYNWLGKPGQYAAARRALSRSLTWSGAVARAQG
jgi:hypothetical protein